MELAQGSFPYSKWNTIFDQLNAVVSGPPPVLPADTFSEPLQQFTAAWYVHYLSDVIIYLIIVLLKTH